MSGDDATRTSPDCFSGRDRGRLRWGQRRGCDSATSGHHDAEKGAATLEQAARSALTENRRLSVYVLWNNRIPRWAERSTAAPRSRRCAPRRRTGEPRHTGAHAREPARDLPAPSRPFIRARDGDRARSPARAALAAQRAPSRSRRDAERARALRTPTVRPERSVRRLESCSCSKNSLFRLGRNRGRRACLRRAGASRLFAPPPIQIGISSQQAGPSRATVRARIAFGTQAGPDGPIPSSAGYPRRPPPIEGRRGRRLARPRPLSTARSELDTCSRFAAVWPRQLLVPGRAGPRLHLRGTPSFLLHARGSRRPGGRRSIRGDRRLGRERLTLSPGRIHTSPRATGLTGATAWFWLDPLPGPRS